MPSATPWKLWVDTTDTRRGHSGIDVFVGQALGPLQLERILTLVYNEPFTSLPSWARQLVWFLGLRPVEAFVCDADFDIFPRLRHISPGSLVPASADTDLLFDDRLEYPFDCMEDINGNTLFVRMQSRLDSAAEFPVMLSVYDWEATMDWADSTTMHWGAQSRQYLSVSSGELYVKLGQNDSDDPWWYVVSVTQVAEYLLRGGWAPPAAFGVIARSILLHEMVLPVLLVQAEEYVMEATPVPVTAGIAEASIYTDGSTNAGLGISGSWVFQGHHFSGTASLACRCGGSAASELLGIAGGLAAGIRFGRAFRQYHFWVDSQNAIGHVWKKQDPGPQGRHLWPGIILCRRLLARLEALDVQVQCSWVSRTSNPAHHVCKAEQRRRLRGDWYRGEDQWPDGFAAVYKEVFRDIGINFATGRMQHTISSAVEAAVYATESP